MTTREALDLLHKASESNVLIDREMVFGYGADDAIEMCRTAVSCEWVDGRWVVVSTWYTFCAGFANGLIFVSGPCPRR